MACLSAAQLHCIVFPHAWVTMGFPAPFSLKTTCCGSNYLSVVDQFDRCWGWSIGWRVPLSRCSASTTSGERRQMYRCGPSGMHLHTTGCQRGYLISYPTSTIAIITLGEILNIQGPTFIPQQWHWLPFKLNNCINCSLTILNPSNIIVITKRVQQKLDNLDHRPVA